MLKLQHGTGSSLKNALRANAVFSGISGLTIVFLHSQVLSWLGINGINITAIGAGLVLFSAYLFWMASREYLPRTLVTGVIAGDWLWVLASVVLLALKGSMFSTLGVFIITDVALLVMVFAIWQQRGLSRVLAAS